MKSVRYLSARRAIGMPFMLATIASIAVLAGCGGGGSTSDPSSTYSVSGTISGLTSSGLALSNDGGAALSIPADATTFSFPATSAATFNVTVTSQPNNPPLSCTVSDGSGAVGQANVTKVKIACVPYQAVGGGVANLLGSGLSLSINGGAPYSIAGNGPFSFPTQLPQGTAYSVKIVQQPTSPSQTCAVVNGSGSVVTSNVSSVAVYCPKPVGRFVYVVGYPSPPSLSAFQIGASGTLTLDGDSVSAPNVTYATLGLAPNSSALYLGNSEACVLQGAHGCQEYGPATIGVTGIDLETGVLAGAPQSVFGSLGSTGFGVATGDEAEAPDLAIAPSGRFGYVTNISEGNIATFTLDPQNDTDVTPSTPVLSQGGTYTSPLVISPSGTVAANITSDGLTTYQLNTQTGAVSPVTPVTGAASYLSPAYPGPVIEPTGRFLYAATTSGITAFAINPATAAITPLPGGSLSAPTGWSVEALYMSAAGTFLYALLLNEASEHGDAETLQMSAYVIDSGTGLLTASSAPPLPVSYLGKTIMVFDPSGTYAYMSCDDLELAGFSIDATTGALIPMPSNPQSTGSLKAAIVAP